MRVRHMTGSFLRSSNAVVCNLSVGQGLRALYSRLDASRHCIYSSSWRGVARASAGSVRDDCKDLPPVPVQLPEHTRFMVTLLRHGQSTWNKQHIIQGSSDHSVLTDRGVEQAQSAAELLQRVGWLESSTHTWASPLQRARQTAEIVHTSLGLTHSIQYLSSLREIDLYSYQGVKKRVLQNTTSEKYVTWQKKPALFEIDGHAPVRELWYRASLVWNTIFASMHHVAAADGTTHSPLHEENILVVAHNATNQALINTALGLPPSMFRRIIQSNASLSKLEFLRLGDKDETRIIVHAINRVPMTSMIEKELTQKNRRKLVLLCGDQDVQHIEAVEGIRSVDKAASWKVIDTRGQDLEQIRGYVESSKDLETILLVDSETCNRMTSDLVGVSQSHGTFSCDPGSLTLLTCPDDHDQSSWNNNATLVCFNVFF